MGLFINSNVSSLNAQRRLGNANSKLTKSFERLSSGLRINSAKDDAAGLAISNRFTSQIRGINQAIRNTQDGVSLAQTAEGALDESNNIVQRIRELAVQSANDTNTQSDRESLQAEVGQLINELDRIAETTTFNSNKILDGSFVGAKFQVGANARETISVSTGDARANQLGRAARVGGTAVSSAAIAANDVVINSVSIRATGATDDTVSTSLNTSSAIAKAEAINDSSAFTGVTAIVGEAIVTGGAVGGGTLDSTNNLSINGTTFTGITVQANDADGSLVDAINAESAATGVTAALDKDNFVVLTAADGRNIEVTANGTGASDLGLAAGVTGGSLTLKSDSEIVITATAGGQAALGSVGGATGAGTSRFGVNNANAVSTIDITTRAGSNLAIEIADAALQQISSTRADLGAVQNRLGSTTNNLSTTVENLSAARSRIQDTDFASETANLSKNQIIQQAGLSVLAQANQSQQIALSLLG